MKLNFNINDRVTLIGTSFYGANVHNMSGTIVPTANEEGCIAVKLDNPAACGTETVLVSPNQITKISPKFSPISMSDLPLRTIHPAYWPEDQIPENWSICDGRTENGIQTPDLYLYAIRDNDGDLKRYVHIMKTGPKTQPTYNCDKYAFTVYDNELEKLYGPKWMHKHIPTNLYTLHVAFPQKMDAAFNFFYSTGHKYEDGDIETIRIPNVGYKVLIRRMYKK